jgi:hypothetical protein
MEKSKLRRFDIESYQNTLKWKKTSYKTVSFWLIVPFRKSRLLSLSGTDKLLIRSAVSRKYCFYLCHQHDVGSFHMLHALLQLSWRWHVLLLVMIFCGFFGFSGEDCLERRGSNMALLSKDAIFKLFKSSTLLLLASSAIPRTCYRSCKVYRIMVKL